MQSYKVNSSSFIISIIFSSGVVEMGTFANGGEFEGDILPVMGLLHFSITNTNTN